MGHPRFRELLAELQQIHDEKTQEYNGSNPPLSNWKLVEPKMRAWEGAYARLTEKIARLFVIVNRPIINSKDLYEVLRDLPNYSLIVRILFEEDMEAKS